MTEPNTDFIYPYDINAESALLGSLILDNSQLGEVVNMLKTEYFYHIPHQLIYGVIMDLYNRHEPFDSVIIKNELIKKGELDKAGGLENIVAIFESVPTASNAVFYARIIKEKYILRRIINLCNGILQKAAKSAIEPSELIKEMTDGIYEISKTESKSSNGAAEQDFIRQMVLSGTQQDANKIFNELKLKPGHFKDIFCQSLYRLIIIKMKRGEPFGVNDLIDETKENHGLGFIAIDEYRKFFSVNIPGINLIDYAHKIISNYGTTDKHG